jgi:hypothetical protein
MSLLVIILSLLLTPIIPDTPTTITLSGDYQPVVLTFTSAAGQTVRISARSLGDPAIDVTLELLLDNESLAFNDDHTLSNSTLGQLDAAIDAFVLPADGEYTLRVNSFSGAQTGEVEITLSLREPLPPCAAQVVELAANARFGCTLHVTPGDSFTLTVRDLSGTLDPVLDVYLDDERVAHNDDHASDDPTLDTLDARVSFTAERETYLVYVHDFRGAAGTFAVEIAP